MNPGAETFQVALRRDGPGQPWGFRLQGGADFSTPLSIQSVNPGSLAESHGLKAGDAVLQINSRSSDELEHEQAKQEIVASGNSVSLVLQRGAVKIWKPKVTPMSELAPAEIKLLPDSVTDGDRYVQKTSLAADKQDVLHIGSGYNRTARPFPGSSAPANKQYNSPVNLYSADTTSETFQTQANVLSGGLQGLSVTDSIPNRGPSPVSNSLLVEASSSPASRRRANPAYLAVSETEDRSRSPARSASPTFLALQQMEQGAGASKQSAMYKETRDGEEIQYQGYTNPRKQSRTFHMLEHGLGITDGSTSEDSGAASATVPGIRSVKAPVFDPNQHQAQQTQHPTCKACGSLIIGVFVRVKGDPLHPECFKCVKCGKNLKNQGYFVVEGAMYCEADARQLTNPNDPDSIAVPVYR